jgi:hypothetical protein
MASKFYKGRLIMIVPKHNTETNEWTVEIEISRRFVPIEKFSSQDAAEKAGMEFAEDWINKRP